MINDAQANLGFVVSQTSHIEPLVYQAKFPEIRYQGLIPVDTSANEWATSVTYYSSEMSGAAAWLNGKAQDVPTVSGARTKFETGVHMAGIGYDYSLEEINQARMLGQNLSADYAMAARRAYEQMVDGVAFNGDVGKGWKGILNYTGVTAASAPNGIAGSPLWANKTPDEILKDFNAGIISIHTRTSGIAMADTVLIPYSSMLAIASRRLDAQSGETILSFLERANVYTAQTGQRLTIRGLNGLDTAGAGGTARMIHYRRSPEVLKMHIPMPHRFLPVSSPNGLQFIVPGIFRMGGLDIRLPKEVLYTDGI